MNRLNMRLQILPSTRNMGTPRTLESARSDMQSLDVSHEHSLVREKTVISTALPFAFESPVIIATPA